VIKLRILRWENTLDYLDGPNITTSVLIKDRRSRKFRVREGEVKAEAEVREEREIRREELMTKCGENKKGTVGIQVTPNI